MLVQFNSDKSIRGSEALALESKATVREALSRVSEHVTWIDMHVGDADSVRRLGSADVHCLIEARLGGHAPITVRHSAPTVAESVDGAAYKLKHAIEGVMSRREFVAHGRVTSAPRADEGQERPTTDAAISTRPVAHADGSTRRPESPTLEGRVPLPEEITGRASGTRESLVELFGNTSDAHLADGFRGGSDDEALDESDDPASHRAPSRDRDGADREAR